MYIEKRNTIAKNTKGLIKKDNNKIKYNFLPFGNIDKLKIQNKIEWHPVFIDKRACEYATKENGQKIIFIHVKKRAKIGDDFLKNIKLNNSIIHIIK